MRFNLIIVLSLLVLMFFSLSTLFSINKPEAFLKGIIFWIISFLILFSSLFIRYSTIFRYPHWQIFYVLTLMSLILLFILPSKQRMWFNIAGFSLQPSEIARIIFLVSLTIFLSKYFQYLKNNFFIVLSFLIVSPIIFLVLAQPDLGMVLLFLTTWFFAILAFLKPKQIILLIIVIFILGIIGWNFVLKDYQKERILTFINPEKDPLGAGYNIRQLKITIGSAGLWGKGYGMGTQAKLGFLPSAETDFILASFIEERGLVGFLLYSLMIFLIIRTILFESQFIKDPLGQVYSYLLAVHLAVKFLLTTSINLGFFPIVGLAVPFLSYGGSHLLTDFILLAIWHNFRNS